jgi:hypothetical protein
VANNTGKKYGGRVAGTPNRTTKETREALKLIIDNELSVLPQTLKQMKPYQRADILTKLIHYVLPKPDTLIETTSSLNEVKIYASFGTAIESNNCDRNSN